MHLFDIEMIILQIRKIFQWNNGLEADMTKEMDYLASADSQEVFKLHMMNHKFLKDNSLHFDETPTF